MALDLSHTMLPLQKLRRRLLLSSASTTFSPLRRIDSQERKRESLLKHETTKKRKKKKKRERKESEGRALLRFNPKTPGIQQEAWNELVPATNTTDL
jgi:hypothetical protein